MFWSSSPAVVEATTMNNGSSATSTTRLFDSDWASLRDDSQPSTVLRDSNSESNTDVEVEYIDVAIVGGGITGLAVATGLEMECSGASSNNKISYRVYERAPKLRTNS